MTDLAKLRCVLVGADSLLLECGETLLQRGHTVAAVAAGSRRVARWAAEKGLPLVDASSPRLADGSRAPSLAAAIAAAAGTFDWLFAITHLRLLPDDVVRLPARGAINFHDGPLPRYAGLNTPAWALIAGEREHGISWHVVTAGIDEGAVVKERRFEIAENETSLSLNTRNFAVAIETFGELVDDMVAERVVSVPQVADGARRVFSRHDRPAALCFLDWTRPAVELERLVRALDFGRYENPLGSAKVRGRDAAEGSAAQILVVTGCEVREDDSDASPGDVVSVDDGIVVRCSEGSLALRSFTTLGGVEVPLADAVALLGASAAHGGKLALLGDEQRKDLTALGQPLARGERTFAERLSALEPVELPWARTPAAGHVARFATLDVDVPHGVIGEEAALAALAIALSRLAGKEMFHLGLAAPALAAHGAVVSALVAPRVPLEVSLSSWTTWEDAVASVTRELAMVRSRGGFLRDLVARTPALSSVRHVADGKLVPIGVRFIAEASAAQLTAEAASSTDADGLVVELLVNAGRLSLRYDEGLVEPARARAFARCIAAVLASAAADPKASIASIDILGAEERRKVLTEWNKTDVVVVDSLVHRLFEEQADRTPDATALIFEDVRVSYRDVDARANQLAHHLRTLGVKPDQLVGVYVERSIDLVIAVLGVHKAGGAYVPLDPSYPRDRITHMIEDSGVGVIITQDALVADVTAASLANDRAPVLVRIDTDRAALDALPRTRPAVDGVTSSNLAYCIYTSGSTGKPKGVLIEHKNVVNFFAGMDERIDGKPSGGAQPTSPSTAPPAAPPTWLAVTSLSFDISVLELLYTLTRGFSVVVYLDRKHGDAAAVGERHASKPMDFSLFYFSGDEAESTGAGKYRLLMEGAKYADTHDFTAVWTPERHFHAFGGLYPQPAVTGAAVAAITKKVGIRAGSVVLPLHHPIRVVEAWAIVDNISNGRVGISVASGWQPNDFVLMPQNHKDAKNIMLRDLEVVRRLWRGEKVSFPGSTGEPVEVQTLPRPVQAELPMWITTAGNPETYAQAGRAGAHVLTHLLGQTVEQLGPKIDAYRKARAEAGYDPATGKVTLMLHTFVGTDDEAVREIVRAPLKAYLGTSLSLLKQYAWAFPAFQKPAGAADAGKGDELANLTPEEHDAVLEFAFERYFETSGLFGTPERCMATVDALKGIGVNEIAALIDFGVATDTVLASLDSLDSVRRRANAGAKRAGDAVAANLESAEARDQSIGAQLARHRVTHMQCTPSMARMLTMHDESRAALAKVKHLFVGGEAFPVALASELRDLVAPHGGTVTNMYGPTETTVWSTTWRLPATGPIDAVSIGTPIANTQIYILDARGQPLPPGVAGELYIAGDGVVRGYLERPELTAERFVADPFHAAVPGVRQRSDPRMYRTGDLARWQEQSDGKAIIEFLGRVDHQVKIRGYRIELGEIEAQLGHHPSVRECVVVVREETPGEGLLVACLSARAGAASDPAALKEHLRKKLPEFMVPSHIAILDDLPHTPNGKIDRKALPTLKALLARPTSKATATAAESDLEKQVLDVWKEILGKDGIGVDENFFDIGGHSLLVVRMHRRLKEVIEKPVALTDLYRFPTVKSFADFLTKDDAGGVKKSADRAAARREALERKRGRR